MRQVRIFLSYHHDDGLEAAELKGKLIEHGYAVWQDSAELLPGDTFEEDIRRVLQTSDAYIVLLTPNSLASSWVLIELGGAWIGGLKLYPVLSDTDPEELPGPIQRLSCCTIDEVDSRLLPALAKMSHSLGNSSFANWTTEALSELARSATETVAARSLARSVAELVADAMSPQRQQRRQAHTIVQSSSLAVRSAFLEVMASLISHDDPRIRGEAYYCLGQIRTQEGRHLRDENFICRGLDDESVFVQACAANALGEYCPLETSTLEHLHLMLSLNAYRTQGNEQVAQLVYYASSTMRRDQESRQKDSAGASS